MSAVARGSWAVAFGAVALTIAGAALRGSDGSLWLLVLLAAVPALLLLVGACAAARTEASAGAYERRLRRTRHPDCACRCHDERSAR